MRWGLESYDEMGSIDLFVIPEGDRKQSAVALKKLNNAKRDHLVWKAGSHVVGPDKLTVFGKLRDAAIARFDANNDGILGEDERTLARQSLRPVLP